MPSHLLKRITKDLDKLYPPFLERFLDVLAACEAKGVHYHANLAFRTYAQQNALYAQGRTKPGPKVTNARGGESPHQFGLACDVIRDADLNSVGLQPAWDAKGYELLFREAQAVGLTTGFFWNDAGHIQVARPDSSSSDGAWFKSLSKIHTQEGLKGVWAHLDATYTW